MGQEQKGFLRDHGVKIGLAAVSAIVVGVAGVFVSPLQQGLLRLLAWLHEPVPVWPWLLLLLGGAAILFAFLYWCEKRLEIPKDLDDNDIVGVLTSWMGHRDSSLNTQVIFYSKVDRELRLKPGSTKRLIERAARTYGYYPETKGENTIRFKYHSGY